MASMLIRLTTLGAVRVHRGDTGYPDLPAQRLRFALLLHLAVERDVSREEVVAMFWPERDTARGKHALRQMLYELRQVLGDDWIDMRRDRIAVDVAVDAAEFESAAEAGRAEDALRLYGGPFLHGFSLDNRSFEAWADRRRAHLARLHRRLQRDHIAQLVAADRRDDALAAAQLWLELDPLEDEAAHTLIERLAAAGQRTAALQYYENYERQLAAELQVEPLEETRALIATIRHGDTLTQTGAAPGNGDVVVQPGTSAGDSHPAPAVAGDAAHSVPAQTRTALPADGHVHARDERRADIVPVRRRPIEIWRAASRARRSGALALLAVLTVAVGLVARPATQRSLAADRPISIAVLPLNDNSMDGTLLPLANVLTEDLARRLAQSPLLDVRSPNGVLLMRAQGAPEDSLGRMLSADYLVGGSVSLYGERVRVDVELLDGRTGRVVRSEAFERPWSESRNLIEDVARGTALFLRREVGMQIDIERRHGGAASEEAFRLVVAAKAIQEPVVTLLEAREIPAALDLLARADSVLEIAARLDRRWAEPLVLRGWILERRAFIARMPDPSNLDSRRDLYRAGLEMAARAQERDAGHAGVHALRGAILHQLAQLNTHDADGIRAELTEAETALRRAAELDPLNQSVWRRLAELLLSTSRYGEARVAAERGYRLDPYGPEVRSLTYLLFSSSFETGRDQDAHGWCSQGMTYYEGDLVFLYCMLALHAWADGVEPQPELLRREMTSFQQGDRRNQPQLMPRFETMIAAAYARAGQPDSAHAILRRVSDSTRDEGVLWMRASVHALLGEDSTALALLEEWLATDSWGVERVAESRPFWHLRERTELQRLIDIRSGARAAAR
jgi:DNA-binding SARP family transcriptional activator/TolB-like protein